MKKKAAYWINNRFNKDLCNLEQLLPEYLEWKKWCRPEESSADPGFISKDSIIAPHAPQYAGIVEIRGDDSEILAIYEKNDRFREIIRDMDYEWNGSCWYRRLNACRGRFCDRAAELVNLLLKNGFTVSIADREAREQAITGNFLPEHKRCPESICRTQEAPWPPDQSGIRTFPQNPPVPHNATAPGMPPEWKLEVGIFFRFTEISLGILGDMAM